jgi:thioredoxin-related protein
MEDIMRKFAIIAILIIGISVSYCSGNNNDDKAHKGNEKVTWLSFDEGLAKAKSEKKNMIVDFYTDWCHWCKVMDEKTFNEANVSKKLKSRFIAVRLNAEDGSKTANYKGQEFTNIELTQAFGVRGFPSLAFIDPTGEVITIVPRYVPAETFSYLLEFIDTGCYKKQMKFEDYMKKKGKCK